MSKKVKVIPCSGIGKVYGLIARESVLKTVKELCPGESETVCLAYVVTGDKEAREMIEGKNCITLDGCPSLCAKKNTELAGGIIRENIRVVDAFRRHKGAKPGTATELTGEGWQIADEIAGEIAAKVKKLNSEFKQ
jgi:uncharacterized metal-binding protein